MTDELNLQLSDRKFYRLQFILCVLLDRIENYPVFIPNEIEEPVQQKMLAGTLLQQFKNHITPDIQETCYLACRLQQLHISNLDISGEINETYINMVVIHLLQCLEVHYSHYGFHADTVSLRPHYRLLSAFKTVRAYQQSSSDRYAAKL